MNKPHKWHKEIKAWADGAEIQGRFKNAKWINIGVYTPQWDDKDWDFRIKPQPKEPQYLYVTDGAMGLQFWRDKQYQENPGQWNIGKIKLEQDDE